MMLVLLPVGVPTIFTYVLYKNRETLTQDTSKDIDIDLFKKTMRLVSKHADRVHDDRLEELFSEIDVDESGKISMEELWQFAASDLFDPLSNVDAASEPDYIELVKGMRNANVWWRRSRSDLRFLVRAYERILSAIKIEKVGFCYFCLWDHCGTLV